MRCQEVGGYIYISRSIAHS